MPLSGLTKRLAYVCDSVFEIEHKRTEVKHLAKDLRHLKKMVPVEEGDTTTQEERFKTCPPLDLKSPQLRQLIGGENFDQVFLAGAAICVLLQRFRDGYHMEISVNAEIWRAYLKVLEATREE